MFSIFRKITLAKKYLLNPKPFDGPEVQNDFAMYSNDIEVSEYTSRLSRMAFKTKELAKIAYNGLNYSILQIDVTGEKASKRLLLFAGVHGNEFAAALAIEDIISRLELEPRLYSSWAIRIITPINPVGLAYNSRYNEAGYDINRDFKHFKTRGAQLQRDAIDEFKPDIVLSLHESPSEGFFMFSEGKLPPKLKAAISNRLNQASIALAEKSYLGIKTIAGIWEKPFLVFLIQRILGMSTLGSYAHGLRIPTITTETTWSEHSVNARKEPHMVVFLAILENSELL